MNAMATVRDVMTADVVSISPDASLKEVAELLARHRISGLPVVQDGRVLGVISEADLLARAAAMSHEQRRRVPPISVRARHASATRSATTAGQAMTAPAVTVAAARAIGDAARLMVERRIGRLPVVEDGCLIGIVTRGDLVRTFARPDDELAELVRRDVLIDTMWLDPSGFRIAVAEGIVHIRGAVDRRSTASIVTSLIARIPGVVGVESALQWAVDDRDLQPEGPDFVSRFTAR